MPLNFGFQDSTVPFAGAIDPFLGGLLNLGAGIAGSVIGSRGNDSTFRRGFLDIPGIDLQSPIVTERTAEMAACGVGLTSAFHDSCNGTRSTPQPHVRCNPRTGKVQWFHPVRMTGFSMTHRKRRRVAHHHHPRTRKR